MSVTNKPNLEVYIGATGSGKGVSIKARLKSLAAEGWPFLIWDPRDEYGEFARQVNAAGMVAAVAQIRAGGTPRVRFVPDGKTPLAKAFAWFCEAAFKAGQCVMLAEELSDVTTPSLAPPAWKRCLTQGRHVGLYIIGAAQRPALIDKTILGQATYIRCFMLRYRADRRAMAEAMDVLEASIQELSTTDDDDKGRAVITTEIRFYEVDFRRQTRGPDVIRLRKRRGAT